MVLLSGVCTGAGAARSESAIDAAMCQAEVAVEPGRAYVGEQVVHRVRVLRREGVREVRWLRAPSFPSLRAEWLPGRTADPRISGIGDAFLVSEDRRALFAVRAGTLEIPPSLLGCRLATGVEQEVTVPGVTLVAQPLPAEGRPADFAGVVGPVQVRVHLSTRRVRLGETLRLAVVVAGEANVWAAAAPLDPAQPDVDVYPRPDDLQLEPGERLRARRTFVWELVPRRAGPLALPAPRVPWFDPASGGYAVAEGPPPTVDVRPAAATPAAPLADAARAATPEGSNDGAAPRRWLLALVALMAAAAGAAAAGIARRRAAPLRAAAEALAEAERAGTGGDPERAARALAAALRAGLVLRVPGAGALAAEEIAARAGGRGAVATAAALLARLDRVRFAGPGGAGPAPSLAEVRAALRALGAARAPR